MKYIKTYEILKQEFHYEIGDYVELTHHFQENNWKGLYAKIVGTGREGHNMEYVYYEIELFLIGYSSFGIGSLFIEERAIRRKLSKKEVEELILKKEAETYNL